MGTSIDSTCLPSVIPLPSLPHTATATLATPVPVHTPDTDTLATATPWSRPPSCVRLSRSSTRSTSLPRRRHTMMPWPRRRSTTRRSVLCMRSSVPTMPPTHTDTDTLDTATLALPTLAHTATLPPPTAVHTDTDTLDTATLVASKHLTCLS